MLFISFSLVDLLKVIENALNINKPNLGLFICQLICHNREDGYDLWS